MLERMLISHNTRPLESFPESPDFAYQVAASRKKGELKIAKIAETATREYAWNYDASRGVWYHQPGEYVEELGEDREIARLKVPAEMLTPPSSDASFYHNHSKFGTLENKLGKELYAAKNQIPSSDDITAALLLSVNGYRDFRIVTGLGVTTITVDKKLLSAVMKKAPTLRLPDVELPLTKDLDAGQNIVTAVNNSLSFLERSYLGLSTIRFQELELEDPIE